jgi:hypothetical protein
LILGVYADAVAVTVKKNANEVRPPHCLFELPLVIQQILLNVTDFVACDLNLSSHGEKRHDGNAKCPKCNAHLKCVRQTRGDDQNWNNDRCEDRDESDEAENDLGRFAHVPCFDDERLLYPLGRSPLESGVGAPLQRGETRRATATGGVTVCRSLNRTPSPVPITSCTTATILMFSGDM